MRKPVNDYPRWDQRKSKKLLLFDVDGTLTPNRLPVSSEMLELLSNVRQVTPIAFVGGSDLAKQQEQLGNENTNVVNLFDFAFAENGVDAYENGNPINSESFISWLGEDKYKEFVNFVLKCLSETDIPKKRGTFIEFRKSMVNVSPIGRNATHKERCEFEIFDKLHGIRKAMIVKLKEKFVDLSLQYSIGGQISFDVFPVGWDKTYCLNYLETKGFEEIHFFGDKTFEGGNDYEIFHDSRVIGHSVTCPEDTMKLIKELITIS